MKRLYSVMMVLFLILAVGLIPQKKDKKEKNIPTVGVIQLMSHPALDQIYQGLKAQLAKEGYIDGKTVHLVLKNAQGDQSQLKTISNNFVTQKMDVTVGIATPSAMALANETQQIPIILGAITDPVAAGLIKDVKHPGGNITGVSDQAPIEAQLKLIQKLTPQVRRLGILYSSGDDSARTQMKLAQKTAEKLGFEVEVYSISSTNDIDQVTQNAASQVDAFYVPTDNQIASAMQTVVKNANAHKIPIYPAVDSMVKEGGLASISINQYELGKLTGDKIVAVLKGKNPGNIPIEYVKKGKLVINQKQADILGITIPAELEKEAEKNE